MDVSSVAAAQTELASTQPEDNSVASTFDKQGFLRLLVTQLQNQDPLNPMKNEEFVGQMTQFATLEEMQNMGANFAASTRTSMITSAANLVGKEVTLESLHGDVEAGKVDKIRYVNDQVELFVNHGWHSMTDLVGVAENQTNTGTLNVNDGTTTDPTTTDTTTTL